MYDNPNSQFHEDLVASYRHSLEVLRTEPIGMSKGLKAVVQAASALFHFREHLPSPISLSAAQVSVLCPEYALLGDVTNVSKHGKLTRGTPAISDASVFSDYLYAINFEDDEGLYTHVSKEVRITFPNGGHVDAMVPLTRVINFWGQYLVDSAVLSSFTPFPEPTPVERISVSRIEAVPLSLECFAGGRFKGWSLQILAHNYVKGVNLPGPLPYRGPTITVKMIDPATGSTEDWSYNITEDERREFDELQSDEERQSFVERIAVSRKRRPPTRGNEFSFGGTMSVI